MSFTGMDPTALMDMLQKAGQSTPAPDSPMAQAATSQPGPQTPSAPPPTPQPQQSQGADFSGFQQMPDQQQQRLQGVKGYLANILHGVGEGMKAHLGMETDAQQQQREFNQGQQQKQLALQSQNIQSEISQRAAQVQQMQSLVTIQTPQGMMQVPFALAKPYIESNAKIQAAATGKPFVTIPNVGVMDTRTKEIVPGSGPKSVTVTQDMVTMNGIPKELLGQTIPLGQFASLEKGAASATGFVQGAQGPAIANKFSGDAKSLGLGAPAGNQIAAANLDLKRQEFASKMNTLSPAAQGVVMQTQPAMDQIDQLMQKLEPMKDINTPAYFAGDRLKYAIGMDSNGGEFQKSISQLELNRILAGTRLLKGGSRAIEALRLAMVHAPDTWKDSPQLMYNKLSTIKGALQQAMDAANVEGQRGATVMPSNATDMNRNKIQPKPPAGRRVIDLTK